jgi:adenosylhomocysteine nucleosidase
MIGVVTGVRREAACLAGVPVDVRVACSGAREARAASEARRLADLGVVALLSFGVAGGLARDLRPGDLLVPDAVTTPDGTMFRPDPGWRSGLVDGLARVRPVIGGLLVGSSEAVASPTAKGELARRSGAVAVDMESVAVARVARERGLPFAVVRAIADPHDRELPAAAMAAVGPDGGVSIAGIVLGLLRHPGQLPALIRLSLDSAAGLATLSAAAGRLTAPPHSDR